MRAFFLASVITWLASFAPAQAAEGELDGWRLAQWNREEGQLDVYISRSAVRLCISKSGLVVLASAPWKEVDMYCTKTGNVFKTTIAKFRNPWVGTMAMFDGGTVADIDVVLKGPTKSIGLPCQIFVQAPGFSQRQMARHRSGATADRAPMTAEYIVSDYFKADPQVGQVMSKFFAVPTTNRVPLQFTYTNVVHAPDRQLQTVSCKKVKLKAADFKLPPGLKTVKEGMSVLVPENSDSGLDLMMMGRSKVK